jgi:hypothetical protein
MDLRQGIARVHSSFFYALPRGAKVYINSPITRSDQTMYVKGHTILEGEPALQVETHRYGKGTEYKYTEKIIKYSAIDSLSKEYDEKTAIELRLIYNSLCEKSERITALESRISVLEERLGKLEQK